MTGDFTLILKLSKGKMLFITYTYGKMRMLSTLEWYVFILKGR